MLISYRRSSSHPLAKDYKEDREYGDSKAQATDEDEGIL